MNHADPTSIAVAGQDIAVWPTGAAVQDWVESTVKVALFDDIAGFHPGLIAKVLELEHDADLGKRFDGIAGSSKIYHLDRWDCAEAELIDARARTLFKKVLGTDRAAVDLSWANIYRRGDYCLPHSHERATASVVYFLKLGMADCEGSGRGRFCFADPRLKICCQKQPHAVTTPCGPTMREGMMIMFPGQIVHFVDVYKGAEPRITIAWNINEAPVPGPPLG